MKDDLLIEGLWQWIAVIKLGTQSIVEDIRARISRRKTIFILMFVLIQKYDKQPGRGIERYYFSEYHFI